LNSKGDDQSIATAFEKENAGVQQQSDKHAFVKWRYT
jgi:hypothetical protein